MIRTEALGTCVYCGQQSMVETTAPVDQAAVDRHASEWCSCGGADRARMMANARESLRVLTGPDSEQAGYEYSLQDKTVDALYTMVEYLADGFIASMTAIEPGGDVVRMTRGERKIEVERTHKVKRKL